MLSVLDPQSAAEAKEKISDFIKKYHDRRVLDILFYFSGHGLYRDDEFYYVFRTYDEIRPRETCLENSELDDMLRALSPELTVKIVDACNSGLSYIKNPSELTTLNKHMLATKQRFSNCYFLFSSCRDQSSYADDTMSYFTRALLESIISREFGPVRYKDLVNAVADFFDGNTNQRPFFVIQAEQTEVFFSLDENLKALVSRVLETQVPEPKLDTNDSFSPVVAAVKCDAKLYATHEQALARLAELGEFLSHQQVPLPLRDLFELEYTEGTGTGNHIGAAGIGQWLHEYGADVMAEPTYKFLVEAQTIFDRVAGRIPRKHESTDVNGYEHTVDVPFAWAELKACAKLPNLHQFVMFVVPLLSRADLYLLSGIVEYGHKTWSDLKVLQHPTWDNNKVSIVAEGGVVAAGRSNMRKLWDRVARHVARVVSISKEETAAFIHSVRESG